MAQLGTSKDPCCMVTGVEVPEKPPLPPAQCGAPPQGPGSKFNQPDAYLNKLYEKYPYLHKILKMAPTEDLVKAVTQEKYKSTYQVDFGRPDSMLGVEKEERPEPAGKEGLPCAKGPEVCGEMSREADDGRVEGGKCTCSERVPCNCAKEREARTVFKKPAAISKMTQRPRTPKNEREEKAKKFMENIKPPPKPKPLVSEYYDTIGKVGKVIIKKKLLYKENK